MSKRRRFNMKRLLADPDQRRKLMVSTIQATQAREGIETTELQAENAYYVVTEGDRAAFFDLKRFSPSGAAASDEREKVFSETLLHEIGVRFDVARRDFAVIEGSPLAYRNLAIAYPLFRDHPKLATEWADVQGGMNSTESDRFIRYHWEITNLGNKWKTFSKGGAFNRFYGDLELVINWANEGAEYEAVVKDKYGSASRFVKSKSYYGRAGITWTEMTSKGFSVRKLPEGAIFNCKGPCAFPKRDEDSDYILAVLNSYLAQYMMNCLTYRSYGSTYVGQLPIPKPPGNDWRSLSDAARRIHDAKAFWDEGNETCTRFRTVWILREEIVSRRHGIETRLDNLIEFEKLSDASIQGLYAQLNTEVYKLYGIPEKTRSIIEETLGDRPPEVLWPQMEGKSLEQKRMEHIWRLLSYVVKRVVDADEDGVVPYQAIAGKAAMIDRVREELATLFPDHDVNKIEVEIVNELKIKVPGYRTVASIEQWIEDVYFEFHCSLHKNRPIIWHITSKQGRGPQAFGALCDYHKFDSNRMAKLRGSYLRDAIQTFRREAALAAQESRIEDRQEWQSKLEEVEELDRKLQLVQEGFVEGKEGGNRDFRILTPWKSPDERPKGWNPDIDDGVAVNIAPLQRAGVLRKEKVV